MQHQSQAHPAQHPTSPPLNHHQLNCQTPSSDSSLNQRLSDSQTPSLLARLNGQSKNQPRKASLQERLSDTLKPLSSRLGLTKSKSLKRSIKSVEPSLQNQQVMMNLNPTHLNDMPPPSTELKPSLLNRLSTDPRLPIRYLESERINLVQEVKDMKNLTGIMPVTHDSKQVMSTTSLMNYPRETSNKSRTMSLEESPETRATKDQLTDQMKKVARTKSSESSDASVKAQARPGYRSLGPAFKSSGLRKVKPKP
jgi:hypothetical protein